MRAVNLLTQVSDGSASRSAALRVSPLTVGAAGASVVAALLAAGFVIAGSGIGTKEAQLAQLGAEQAALPPLPAPTVPAAAQSQGGETALASLLSQRVAWDRLLNGVARVMPSNVWLSAVSAQAPASPAAATALAPPDPEAVPTNFVVTGFTTSHVQVARVITHLAVLPQLTNIHLGSSAKATFENRRLVQFTVAAEIRPGEDGR